MAVIVVNNEGGPPIAMGTPGGTVDIPAMMITLRDGTKLKEHLGDGLYVKLGGDVMIGGPELADQLSPGSSRGPEYETHLLKPDIAAPGFNIHSAWAGGGEAAMLSGGTSMAAPHVAGAAALLIERHPDWTPSILKAALMNTAVQTRDENGAPYPETRTGAGRVNPAPGHRHAGDRRRCRRAGAGVAVVRPARNLRAALGQAQHRVDQLWATKRGPAPSW